MAKPAVQPGSVRIIGGDWRSRRLPVAEVDGLRPSGDRLRETLFNWLMPWMPGSRCLDLYAGTGALGFEAASRGAESVTLVERDRVAAQGLRRSAELLGAEQVSVFEGGVESWLASAQPSYSVVFIDPPYGQEGAVENTLKGLVDGQLLAKNAHVFIEAPAARQQPEVPDDWTLTKTKQFARVAAWLFRV